MKQLRFWIFLLPLLILIGFSNIPATQADTGTGDIAFNEPLTTEALTQFVDAYVDDNMAAAHAPGLVITVVQNGEVILSKGYGMADLETGRPMTTQTNLRAGSVSKPVTSSGVLQLAADGRLDLHAPLSDYVSNLPLDDGYGAAGTVAQHLALKGGYADKVIETHAPAVDQWQPLDEYLHDNLPERVLPPGKVYSYNSWEYALLGQAMAEVSGKPFDQVMDDTLFRPLGMFQTTFSQPLPESIAVNLAKGYSYTNGHYEEVPLDYVNLAPGIALVTTADDMGRFMLALLNGGELDSKHVLAAETVAGMLNRQEEVHPLSRGRTFGLSEITLGGHQVLYHDGNGIGFGSRLILAPEHNLGIFLSVNHRALATDISNTKAYAFMKELSTVLLENYLPAVNQVNSPRAPLPNATERAPKYAGHYRLAGTSQKDFFKLGALLENVNVTANNDGTVHIGSRQYIEVEPLLFQSQEDPGFYVVFVEDNDGAVKWLTFGGTNSFQKVFWYETPMVQIALIAAVVLSFLAFVIVMPFSRYRYWTIWLMSLLGLAFLLGLAYMMTQADLVLFYKTIPLWTRLLFLLPWLIGALALTYPVVIAALWRKRSPVRVWILYAANMVAVALFIWFVGFWNLF